MPPYEWKKAGVFAFRDTGAPSTPAPDRESYPTLVMVHGLSFTAGVFSRLEALAGRFGARIVLINRRGYPGSAPFNQEEFALLKPSEIPSGIEQFAKERARELYDFLRHLVSAGDVPLKSIILAGWSLGTCWITSFLAHASSFPEDGLELHRYVRRLIAYDPPAHLIGYPIPFDGYNPLRITDPVQMATAFATWVSSYFSHGDTLDTLSPRDPVLVPRRSILDMSPEEIKRNIYAQPAYPEGADALLMSNGVQHGLWARLRAATLFPPGSSAWDDIELRYIWCDRSVWLTVVSGWAFEAEVAEARASGKRARNHSIVRLHGANHFAHWDQPEETLRVLLSDVAADTDFRVPLASKL
ncbi:alpha/beta-hydrolase [Gloeopeniophorella convolvens]|nr:alpha/beta-hydrolase [Gloeopeniophorella convolvens]